MSFTDEDLKRLKDHTEECIGSEITTAVPAKRMKALLARLKAAEKCCQWMAERDHIISAFRSAWEPLDEWRKAAGK